MKALLAASFADSRAADLTLAYGLAPLPALGTHPVALPGARVELRVLGASHQIVLELGGARWTETVACLPGQPGGLPARDLAECGPLRSRFRAGCLRCSAGRLGAQVRMIAQRCAGHPWALVGTFPGSPLAITALLVHEAGPAAVGWRSWHAYPQSGELVTTASVVVARP